MTTGRTINKLLSEFSATSANCMIKIVSLFGEKSSCCIIINFHVVLSLKIIVFLQYDGKYSDVGNLNIQIVTCRLAKYIYTPMRVKSKCPDFKQNHS